MNTTQLDTLKTLFGNDLAALLAFLDEIRFNGSYALWRLGSSGLTLQDVEAALNATAWRTSASPKALLPAAGVRHYLVVNTSYAGADAHLQITKETTSCLALKDQLDMLRPDDDTTPIDLGVWNKSDTLFQLLKNSSAMAFDPVSGVKSAFDPALSGEAQLVNVNGETHLMINRETLDTWALQLALKASILQEVASGETDTWAAYFAKQVAPRGGKLDVVRARTAYVVTTLGRGMVWLKKDIALETLRQVDEFYTKPFAGVRDVAANVFSTNTLISLDKKISNGLVPLPFDAVADSTSDPQARLRDQQDYDQLAHKPVDRAASVQDITTDLRQQAEQMIDAQVEFFKREQFKSLSGYGGVLSLDDLGVANMKIAAMDRVNEAIAAATKELHMGLTVDGYNRDHAFSTFRQRVLELDVRIRAAATIPDVADWSVLLPGTLSHTAADKKTLNAVLQDKVGYLERVKEGSQVERLIGGLAALCWSMAAFEGINKATSDDRNAEYGATQTAFLSLTALQLFGQASHMLVWFGANMIDVSLNNKYQICRNDEFYRRAFKMKSALEFKADFKARYQTEYDGPVRGENVWDAYKVVRRVRELGIVNAAGEKLLDDMTKNGLSDAEARQHVTEVRRIGSLDPQVSKFLTCDVSSAYYVSDAALLAALVKEREIAKAVGDRGGFLSKKGLGELIKDQVGYKVLPGDVQKIIDSEIKKNNWFVNNRDTLYFDANFDQLWFRRDGDDLVIDIMGSQDANGNNPTNKVTVQKHYAGAQYQVERFVANGNRVLAAADADRIVAALEGLTERSGMTRIYDLESRSIQCALGVAIEQWKPDTTVGNLITAMAQMAPPAAGTTLTAADYQNRVTSLYTANVMV